MRSKRMQVQKYIHVERRVIYVKEDESTKKESYMKERDIMKRIPNGESPMGNHNSAKLS